MASWPRRRRCPSRRTRSPSASERRDLHQGHRGGSYRADLRPRLCRDRRDDQGAHCERHRLPPEEHENGQRHCAPRRRADRVDGRARSRRGHRRRGLPAPRSPAPCRERRRAGELLADSWCDSSAERRQRQRRASLVRRRRLHLAGVYGRLRAREGWRRALSPVAIATSRSRLCGTPLPSPGCRRSALVREASHPADHDMRGDARWA